MLQEATRAINSAFNNSFIKKLSQYLHDCVREEVKSKVVGNMYNSDPSVIREGDKVIHTVFGEGVVVNISGGIATIAFKHGVGIKSIAANHKYLTKKN